MDNICSNYVSICGDPEEVKEFVEFVESIDSEGKENHFDFNKVIPIKEEDSLSDKWGTSPAFDIIREDYEDGDPNCDWYFWTKWCSPAPIYIALRDKFPDVHIVWTYEEPGCDLYGFLNADELDCF